MKQEGHFIGSVSDYIMWTETTAIYPRGDHKTEMDYLNLGLVGECGEVAQLLKRKVRDPFYQFSREVMLHELGDIAWYYARIHSDHSFSIETPEKQEEIKDLMQKYMLDKADMPDTGFGCMQIGIAIFSRWYQECKNKNIMEILGIDQASLREKFFEKLPQIITATDAEAAVEIVGLKFDDSKVELIRLHHAMVSMGKYPNGQLIGEIIDDRDSPFGATEWAILCDRFGFEPLEVLRANYDKLESRKERGTLHGQGDSR
jgi:NTP pyrophosphatase (non-canonical NTP hydrolase)